MIETLIGAALAVFGFMSGIHALMNKRDPRSTLSWTMLCILLPAVGAAMYWLFGVNRIHIKARRWQERGRFSAPGERGYPAAEVALDSEHPHRAETMSALLRISERVTGRPLLRGNRVEPLVNGEGAYPSMIEAIDSARRSVCLCTYLFDTDAAGLGFIEALGRAAARGVDVRVIIDAVGERYARPRASKLLRRHQGIRVARFLPFTLSPSLIRVNLRNHRKLLIVDSKIGFTGGMNIGQRHMVEAPDNRRPTADLHFRITGPAVYSLEDVFFDDWYFATGEEPAWQSEEYPVEPAGPAMCRAIKSGPNEELEVLTWILVGALSVARERVQIMTPYFIPNRELLSALSAAALRGVIVDILLPERNNLPFVAWATQAMLEEVLQYGIRVHHQPSPFNHSKLFIVDEFYVVLGSANLDPRSLRLNFEFNIEVYDTSLARQLSAHFDQVLARSRTVSVEALRQRSFPVKLRDSVSKLMSPYL